MSFSWAHERHDDRRNGGDDDKWSDGFATWSPVSEYILAHLVCYTKFTELPVIRVLLHSPSLSLPVDGEPETEAR